MTESNNANSWPYTTAAWRQAHGNPANQLDAVFGLPGVVISVQVAVTVSNTSAGVPIQVGIGQDVTNSVDTTQVFGGAMLTPAPGAMITLAATAVFTPAIGRHFFPWLEFSTATGITTWNVNNGAINVGNGISGWFLG